MSPGKGYEDDQRLEHLSYKDRRVPMAAFQYLKGDYKQAGDGLFVRECRDRTKSNVSKLKEGRFGLNIQKKFFTPRVVRHWNRLPR